MRYAGFKPRFFALIIDAIILVSLLIIVAFPLGGFNEDFAGANLVLGVSTLVITFLYQVVLVKKLGATPGKLALGLRILMADGTSPSYMALTTRAAIALTISTISLIPGLDETVNLVATVTNALDFWVFYKSPIHQSFKDNMAKTVVVYK